MYVIMDNECIHCGICEDECPTEAIDFSGLGFQINQEQCVECGLCAVMCPIDAIIEF